MIRLTFALCVVVVIASCGSSKDNRSAAPDTTHKVVEVPPLLSSGVAMPPNGSFNGDVGDDARTEGREEKTTRVGGTATWAIELDTLDLRRKLTIRVALATPDSTWFVLRAIDSNLVAPGVYGVLLAADRQSHRDPRTFLGEIRANDNGQQRRFLLGSDRDTVFIDAADSVIRGRVKLHGDRFAAAKPGEILRDYVSRDIFGEFVAVRAHDADRHL